MVTVYTKKELEKALKAKGAIGVGLASLIAAPFTGGTSLVGFGAAAVALTGGEIIAIIIILCGFGITLAGILNGYEVVEFDKGFVKLRKKA